MKFRTTVRMFQDGSIDDLIAKIWRATVRRGGGPDARTEERERGDRGEGAPVRLRARARPRGPALLPARGSVPRQPGARATDRAAEADHLAAHLHADRARLPAVLRGGEPVRPRERRVRARPGRARPDGRP